MEKENLVETKIIQVEETKDYSVFNRHNSNRTINEKLVNRLKESMAKKSLLRSKPIVVDKEFNIIDGQHRFEAAKRLDMPIAYIIDEEINVNDMETLNTNLLTWGLHDYLNFHVKQNNIEYQLLSDFMDSNKLKLNIALQLLHGCRNPDFFKKFKDGKYKYPSEAEEMEAMVKKSQIQEVINYIKVKTSGPKTYLDKVTFYSAMVEFFNVKSFSYDTFMKKLQYKIDMIHPCTRHGDYVRIFREIYNFKNQQPIMVGEEF